MRPDPYTQGRVLGTERRRFDSCRKAFIRRGRNEPHFGPCVQKMGNDLLVLRWGKRTGRIQKASSLPEHIRRADNDVLLDPGAFPVLFGVPRTGDRLILPEHSLSGTGGIHQHFVKISRKPFAKPGGHFIGNDCVRDPEDLHIFQKCPAARCTDVICHQQALPRKLRAERGRFSSRSGAEVQHSVSRLHIQDLRRRHGTGLLQVIKTCIVKRMAAGAILLSDIISVPDPRNLFHLKRTDLRKRFRRDLQGVDPEAMIPGQVITAEEFVVFIFQQCFHPFQIFRWE